MYNFLSKISLTSWDEAWYGAISANILKTGDFLNLVYNNQPFFDHPPFVLWLQAICMKLFGVTEFAVRFPSFVLGLATLVVLFLLGKEFFGKATGFFASLALLTSPWYISRSLSGNLDAPLTFLFVLSFYFAVLSAKNKKLLIPLSISLSFLFLTKSLVPFTILPVIFFVLWRKVKIRDLVLPIILFLVITLPWFVVSAWKYPSFINKYLSIGYPGASAATNIWENIILTKIYLHNGIGNWFWWGVLSLGFGFIFYRKKYLPIIIFVATFLLPFAFSNKGHIWHLLPLHPFWSLSFFGLVELSVGKILKNYKVILMTVLFLLISWTQIKRNWYEIVLAAPYTSDLEILATKTKEYNEQLYVDDDAIPEVVFYSQKDRVERIRNRGDVRIMFNSNEKFLLIIRDWRLVEENIKPSEYEFIAKDRDKVLLLKR